MPDKDALHVIAGPSAAACLRNGLGLTRDQVLVHHDLLSCGPLPPLDSLDEWREVRESYLRLLHFDGWTFSFDESPYDVLTHHERLRNASTVTLWLGTGLGEQLLLAWLVALLHELDGVRDRCRIVQFDHHEGHEVLGVGMLPPSAFAHHPPTMAHDMEVPERKSDSYLFARLRRLADEGLPRPLLALHGDTTHLHSTEVRLTEHGEALLEGAGNAVEWNGIDDWVGGVHLDPQNGTFGSARDGLSSDPPDTPHPRGVLRHLLVV